MKAKVGLHDREEVGTDIARRLGCRVLVLLTSFSLFKGLLLVDSFEKAILLKSEGGLN